MPQATLAHAGTLSPLIPAQAGIQGPVDPEMWPWIPAFAGVSGVWCRRFSKHPLPPARRGNTGWPAEG